MITLSALPLKPLEVNTGASYRTLRNDQNSDTTASGSGSPTTQHHALYLFSLPASNLLETSTLTHTSLLVRRIWEWKDDILGDGRDFFVPRPKTLMALNSLLKRKLPNVEECVVLSNCARFDILLVVAVDNNTNNISTHKVSNDKENKNDISASPDHCEEETRQSMSQILLQQLEYYKLQKKRGNNMLGLASLLDGGDQPTRLWLDPPPPNNNAVNNNGAIKIDQLDAKLLANNLQVLEGPNTIARYLCRVATGLQPQGRRPDRKVVFRPFSSRDAHVMLQLKRTADITSPNNNSPDNNNSGSQPRLKALLDTALQSGKAARDPNIVPAILPLKRFGSDGRGSRYSLGEAPAELCEAAAQQACEIAIEPMVEKYVDKWAAFEVSEQIQSFRQAATNVVQERFGFDLDTAPEAKPIRSMLHPHIMDIREGRSVDTSRVLDDIRSFKL